jgi:hypothetical protein
MARAMARQAVPQDQGSMSARFPSENFDDLWPEEPTQVDSAMTMEELILEELGQPTQGPSPANDARVGTKKET